VVRRFRRGGGTAVAPPPSSPVTKVIVAVHGVGDQYSYATIQSVVKRFCGFYHEPAGIPLGNFHTGQPAFSISPPYPPDPFGRFAFAEVYWAKVPRTLVDDKHTLEEAKKWARTIVERLRMRWRAKGRKGGCGERDFRLLEQVLTEMIQTIAVLDRICFLADKTGLFTFDLRQLLEDYLGDVQIVTEFAQQRAEILQTFAKVMSDVHQAYPSADIYLVAHSEGTVVSFLGLLQAYNEPVADWAEQVRGFMTLGSPIDKHLTMWPELFTEKPPARLPSKRVEWRNYYDHGHPIGFALDDARAWLRMRKRESVFNFSDAHDFGFTRYAFPGKAHVDYWEDDGVFDHFISTVVNAPFGPTGETLVEGSSDPPGDRRLNQFLSYVLPYAGVVALVVVAAYVLFKAVTDALYPSEELYRSKSFVAGEVAVTALLISGITVTARIPRLTRNTFWWAVACLVGVVTSTVYFWNVHAADLLHKVGLWVSDAQSAPTLAILLVALVFGVSTLLPSWGMVPLMVLGTAAIVSKLTYNLRTTQDPAAIGPLWPVFIAGLAFLYLWRLAALLFDLVFVWHLYVRHARVLQRIDEVLGGSRARKRTGKWGKAVSPSLEAPQVQR
jgi:hypothetical protein